ncbi:MAG: hypothetical protein ACE5E9_13735 [Nitrospinaceae bacterium]
MSEHHEVIFHDILQSVRESITRAHRFGGPLGEEIDSIYNGLGLIVCQSFLEREMNKFYPLPAPRKFPARMPRFTPRPFVRAIDFWHYKFDRRNQWYGWEELTHLYRIRYRFDRNRGILNRNGASGHGPRIRKFHGQLAAGDIRDREGNRLGPYFDIDSAGALGIKTEAVNRCTALCGELIRVVEKHLGLKP